MSVRADVRKKAAVTTRVVITVETRYLGDRVSFCVSETSAGPRGRAPTDLSGLIPASDTVRDLLNTQVERPRSVNVTASMHFVIGMTGGAPLNCRL